jgi:hypothetical protein
MVFLVVNAIAHPRTGNEGAEWEWSFLSLASTVDGVVGRWSRSGLKEARWSTGPVWMVAENLSSPRFVPRTVQPVTSRYTD